MGLIRLEIYIYKIVFTIPFGINSNKIGDMESSVEILCFYIFADIIFDELVNDTHGGLPECRKRECIP